MAFDYGNSDYSETEAECTCDSDCEPLEPMQFGPWPRCAREKWYDAEFKAPIERANTMAEAKGGHDSDEEAEYVSKSVIMNLYMDCDLNTAEEIVGVTNHRTRALCRLDNEIPSPKNLIIIQGPHKEVWIATRMIESQLERLRKEMSGLKPMHVAVEGVGDVEVCIIHG